MKKIDRILLIAIVAPLLVALILGGGSVLITGIRTILRLVVPNTWTLIAYAYVAIIAYLIGKSSKGNKSGK